jgi:hypothetical protein
MPALKILELSFHIGSDSSIPAWHLLANVPKLPNLEQLILEGCNMTLHALAKFVLKQTHTLRVLSLSNVKLHEAALTDVSLFYLQLSIASRVDDYRQSGLALVTDTGNHWWLRYVGLPRHLCLPYTDDDDNDDENDDGYVEIWVLPNIMRWKGREEVKDMLSNLSVCLF